MQSSRERLIRELVSIYQRYTSAEIDEAFQALRSGEAFASFSNAALSVPKDDQRRARSTVGVRPGRGIENRIRRGEKRGAGEQLDQTIVALRELGGASERMVSDLLEAAREGKILRTSASVFQFLTRLGVAISERQDRLSMLRMLGKHLLAVPVDQLESLVKVAEETENKSSSLQKWADIIVRKEQK